MSNLRLLMMRIFLKVNAVSATSLSTNKTRTGVCFVAGLGSGALCFTLFFLRWPYLNFLVQISVSMSVALREKVLCDIQ